MNNEQFLPFEDNSNELYISNDGNEATFSNDYGLMSFYSSFDIDLEEDNTDNITFLEQLISTLSETKDILIKNKEEREDDE